MFNHEKNILNWDEAVNLVSPFIVQISTPHVSGTGFMCLHNANHGICGIATALHVVDHANEWQEPIKLFHYHSKKYLYLNETERAIFSHQDTDSAMLLIKSIQKEFSFPMDCIPFYSNQKPLNLGSQVGWLGFPYIEFDTLCFFSGNVSAYKDLTYIIDGVAIHGVSGGPVFCTTEKGIQIIGTVSAYRADIERGETSPGLMYAHDVSYFQSQVNNIETMEEARQKMKLDKK